MPVISITYNFSADRRAFYTGVEAEAEIRKVSKCLHGRAKVRVLYIGGNPEKPFVPTFYDIELEADRQFLDLDKWATS